MNKALVSRLILGTVQLGCHYGVANKTGQMPKKEALKVLRYAYQIGVKTLDTSYAYGESESIIGEFMDKTSKPFDVISKLVFDDGGKKDIQIKLQESFHRLNIRKIYGYLIHRFADFRKKRWIWESLKELKASGLIEKIGFSLYRKEEIDFLLKEKILPDILQFPYSVFDRRLEPYFQRLKDKGVELHARSVFLQGLVYLDPRKLPVHLKKAEKSLETLQNISKEKKIPISAICLDHVLSNPYLDKVIIGVDGLEHFKENVKNLEWIDKVRHLKKELKSVVIDDEDILLPYKWR